MMVTKCKKCGTKISNYTKNKLCIHCFNKSKRSSNKWRDRKKCIDCGAPVSFYAKRCKSCAHKEDLNYRWKGGRRVTKDGYILVYVPNHPFNGQLGQAGYVFEHRLVMEKHLGRYLKPKEVVHHIDGVKGNNKIGNLMLFPTSRAHQLFKHVGKKTFICKFCKRSQDGNR